MKKIIVIILVVVAILISLLLYNGNKNKERLQAIKNQEIEESFSDFVITNKKTKLYDKNKNETGDINSSVKLRLDKDQIDGYYRLKDFDEYYIYYKDFDKTDSYYEYDSSYKKYIVFNKNVKTKGKTSFYDDKFNYLYTVNKEYELPLYINDDEFYGVEYDDHLVYIKKGNDVELIDANNSSEENAKSIPVFLYHFFHNHTRFDNMTTVISMRIDRFEEQMKYLSDNDFMTLKLKDLENYIKGKVQIKEKSVVITIDDGSSTIYSLAYPVLEKYKINATVFAITSNDSDAIKKQTDYVEIHSHTHNMHQTGKCSGGQGGYFKCIDYNLGIEDLKKSRELLNNTTYLAYPFGEYTDNSIKMLKDSGFTMALTTNYGNAKVGDDPYLVPRIYIYNEYGIDTFKRLVN